MKGKRPHHWCEWHFGRRLCCTCGLVGLKNEASQRASRAPCPGADPD